MQRRFGDVARIHYHDAEDVAVRAEYASLLGEIEARGLLYPVTVVDDVPIYDGAVSYPGILRAVQERLEKSAV
ncbi:MAG TPA: hypothetical protein VFH17_04715 [Coriobacteriia bacterium]|nr:hypothetical protein [Coriobacteriia bacterium]